MMDVENSNRTNTSYRNYLKKSDISMSTMKFSIETYFVWFSALIFITELITDICLVAYYFHQHEIRWGLMTLAIIILPLMLCQLYSLILLKSQKSIGFSILIVHLLLMGIPYRYHNILRRVDTDKMSNQELINVQQMIHDVKNLQTLNAVFQYCPQFIFQAFLIVYKNYKCIITGVSAGLAAFSFLWHNFIHFYYYVKKLDGECVERTEANAQIIDNLTATTMPSSSSSSSTTANLATNFVQRTLRDDNDDNSNAQQNDNIPIKHYRRNANLSENIKIFEKPTYNTDDKNLVSKKQQLKNVEKTKIFNFNNKRKALYETDDFNICNTTNMSTVFFEINDSNNEIAMPSLSSSKLNLSVSSNKTEDFHNENNTNINLINKKYQLKSDIGNDFNLINKMKCSGIGSGGGGGGGINNSTDSIIETRILKRKGICSSQEMLHLVDVMNDIPPEEVDMLAKSLIEMGGEDSLKNDSDNADNSKLLENFPEFIDEKIVENIDAAIYENQIIFQERIRKNQLTIQNLKLQDQLLSKYIEEIKNLPSTELINIRDYENMCFANVSRTNRLKHWRNYLQDINTNMHDNSTVQNSSLFYVNTMSNSLTDLYVNGTDIGSVVTEDGKLSDQISLPLSSPTALIGDYPKKCVRWSEKLITQQQQQQDNNNENNNLRRNHINNDNNNILEEERDNINDNLYININGPNIYTPHKNILVETINAINDVESPIISHLCKKKVTN